MSKTASYWRGVPLALLIIMMVIGLAGCSGKDVSGLSDGLNAPVKPCVVITFDYEKQSGYASNQFAVWIEDADGNLVRTLYATRFTANGGFKSRPDSIPIWVEKAGLAAMSKTDVDAITQATPNAGRLSYVWDLKDAAGIIVPNSEYKYFVEGSLRWKNHVLYSGVINVGAENSRSEAVAEYSFEGDSSQPELTEAAPETRMLTNVKAEFLPAE